MKNMDPGIWILVKIFCLDKSSWVIWKDLWQVYQNQISRHSDNFTLSSLARVTFIIRRYCGTTMPHPLTSFGRTLSISFISNNVATAKGFHAIFAASTSACGGIFHMERGAFNSPNFPEPYPPNIECVWNIPTSPGNRLQLSFTEFELEESANCAKDYLEIREGALESQLMGRYCGSSLVLNHTSIITSQFLWVKFVSDSSGSGLGFMATFSHLFGNNIVGSSGQIASPLWPRNYPHNSNYQWTITVNATQLIHGQLQQMSIEESSSCRYDKLKVYDGPNIHSHLIDVYCGVTLSSFTSSGNSVTLQFISDISVSGKGFLLDWYAVEAPTDIGQTVPTGACGGVATASNAPLFLFSPGWPSDYSNMANCIWVIRSRSSTVEFNILALDIETHGSCNYDKLVFRDGDNSLAPVLSTVCGREIPGPIRSTGDSMFIQFTSDGSVTGAGFNASFHKSCGGYLHANRGVITSPNYGQTYPANLNCSWHVLVTSGFIIDVHFEQPFEVLNEDASCSHGDYVELRNGPDLFAPPLGLNGGNGRFCGSSPFSTMHTSDNQLFVLFTSDSHNGGKGFQLKYEAKSLACGGNFYISHSSSSGYVHSPNYPGNYPPHADCVWTVTVLYGEAVELQFEDQIDIEPSPNCTSSYLELRDGADSSSPLIAQLCGNSLPPIQRSSGPTLYMRFRSDSTDARAGFNAKYSRAPCGGTLTGQNGFIKSLGFPDLHYQDNLQCEWFLHGPMGHYLSISFEALDIQNSTECANDYLEIREHDASGDLLGKYCGATIPGALDTPDNLAYIKFVADDSINAPGFMLRFAASFQACGGELRGTTGIFTSPNNLNPSLHKLKCEWRIVVPLGRRVTLTFSDMNFDLSLQELWSTQVKSSGNKITVIMVKSHNEAEESFRIIYSSEEDAVCGGLLLSSKGGNLTSPGYDGTSNYLNNLNCEWVIQNSHPSATTVYLSFGDFKLEEHINCQNDYLEIRLGDADGELLYRLCGSRVRLEPLLIAAPQIWMQFLSNAENTNRGFFIRYTSSACGGIQEAESGIISSPNYPQPYNSSSHCSWLLVAPEGHTINLTFVTFAVERHSSCPWDSVTILNGGSLSSPIIGRYCGNTSPGTIQSGSNKLLINFNSDHSVQGDGFYATWTADSLGCGGILHSENGTIRSPYWPHNFPSNIRCAWTIIAHESKHLEITFDENFQIPDTNGQCQSSYVKVLSGSSEEQEDAVLAVGCGNSAPVSVVAPRNVITVLFQSQDDPGQGFSASYISRCGANFTAQSGQIVSPNFPSQYDNNLNCNYTIDVEPQSVVILHFESFDLQSPGILEICSYDGVKIFKKNSANLSHMETICGNEVPAPVSIFGSTLLNFYTDSHTVGMGFLVTYRIIACGGVFNSSVGTISSPTHSFSDYHHNMNCSYNITVRRNKIVQLKFNSFQLEASSSCYKDYVAVYDGPNTLAPLLGKFCGTALPPTIRTSTNNLFLVFTTDFLEAAGGWKASYTETIDSNMDGKYDKDLECVWTIVTSVNRLINLTFNTFQLEAASGFQNCRYDYVKLYDGSNDNATLAGTFCGSNIPAPFLSTDNFLTIKFVTDRSVERAGFTATYTTMDRLCGGTYNATSVSQTMTSPYFPQAYPPFTVCRWVIDAPPEQQVQLVVQMFHLHSSQDCSQNYLEFQDFPLSNQEHADRVHRFCGDENVTVPVFYSYRRTAIIIFRSEAYMTNNGLNFSYKASGCSREYNQSFGYLKSPGWPDSYPRNLNCVIILRAPQNHTLSLFFTSFNLEGFGCQNDFLELDLVQDFFGGGVLMVTQHLNIFPNKAQKIIEPTEMVVMQALRCLANIVEVPYLNPSFLETMLYIYISKVMPYFLVVDMRLPGLHHQATDCEWIIKAPKGRTVTINFVFISIEDPGDCTRNYLILYNGPDHRHPQIGPYCGMLSRRLVPAVTSVAIMSKSLKKIVEESREKNILEVDMCERNISNMVDIPGLFTLSHITQLVLSHNKLTSKEVDNEEEEVAAEHLKPEEAIESLLLKQKSLKALKTLSPVTKLATVISHGTLKYRSPATGSCDILTLCISLLPFRSVD
uniref:Uncharacterized protein n=1 Tax=Sphaerodactylus townsendi TaxID=933632 RepID=A0ACB8FV66_9SAUR